MRRIRASNSARGSCKGARIDTGNYAKRRQTTAAASSRRLCQLMRPNATRQTSRALGGRIRLNQHSGTPVYIQLADQLKYLIGIGELPPGARLPSARLLSSNLNINRNTVLSAYAILAAESLVVGHRGGGTLVATPPADKTEE